MKTKLVIAAWAMVGFFVATILYFQDQDPMVKDYMVRVDIMKAQQLKQQEVAVAMNSRP